MWRVDGGVVAMVGWTDGYRGGLDTFHLVEVNTKGESGSITVKLGSQLQGIVGSVSE